MFSPYFYTLTRVLRACVRAQACSFFFILGHCECIGARGGEISEIGLGVGVSAGKNMDQYIQPYASSRLSARRSRVASTNIMHSQASTRRVGGCECIIYSLAIISLFRFLLVPIHSLWTWVVGWLAWYQCWHWDMRVSLRWRRIEQDICGSVNDVERWSCRCECGLRIDVTMACRVRYAQRFDAWRSGRFGSR
jgi:hypothetical protein